MRVSCWIWGVILLSLSSCGPAEPARMGAGGHEAKGQGAGGPVKQAGFWEPLWEGPIQAKPVLDRPPSPVPPEVYSRNRREALEKLVEKLSGNGTRRSWNFSKELLRREKSDEIVQEMVRFLNRYLSSELQTSVAKNAIQVMSAAADPVYAKALLIAARHSDRTVREEALKALIQSGDEASTDTLMQSYAGSDTREKALRVRILARQWPPEKAIPFLRRVLADPSAEGPIMREQVLRSFTEVDAPAKTIQGSLEDNLFRYKGLDLITASSLQHKSGGEQGRLELLRMLAEETQAKTVVLLISGLSQRVPGASLEFIDQRLQQLGATGRDPIVQAVLAAYLGEIGGASEIARLEVMARFEDSRIAHAALEALQGKKARLDWIAKAIETGTGTELRRALEDAVAAQDAGSVPAMIKRLNEAEGADRWRFIQALGRSRAAGAVTPLLQVIQDAPMSVLRKGQVSSCGYAAEVIANIPDSEQPLWELYARLGKDPVRRSLVIDALAKVALLAQDGKGKERKARIHARFRTLFYDPKTPERERLQILGNMLMHSVELADAMRLKRMLRKEEKTGKIFEDTINSLLFELF